MVQRRLGAAAATVLWAASAAATTWNEPWQDQVARGADSLGLFEVLERGGGRATVRTIKTLAGTPTPRQFTVDSAFSAAARGRHDEELGLALRKGSRVYLWLDGDAKQWQLPTPTAGIAGVMPDGNVAATYRISPHQAVQAADAYERVQTCVFRHLHGEGCDTAALAADLDAPLQEDAAALSETATPAEQARFFRQHVALESAFLLQRPVPLARLEPFLRRDFFHTQISAVRALAVSDEAGRDARWIAFIKDDARDPAARAMALFLARERKAEAVLGGIEGYAPADPKAECALVPIMDPRIGTRFPGTLGAAFAFARGQAESD
ncbi:hypothetical protein [Tahibacter caeni]|uniref:hypothetical protein n=1 Tax=Tahibacter caeni TaxID=1453545 RepID=UPI002147A1FA|nr:hypothetical protein [Tahibacter caeni]